MLSSRRLTIFLFFTFVSCLVLASEITHYQEIDWTLLSTYQAATNESKEVLNTDLKNLFNKPLKLTGFMMPLDYSGKKIKSFLFMSYIPSCEHVPPPPSNQTIFVTLKDGKEVEPTFTPITIKGTLKLENQKELNTPFSFQATSIDIQKK